MFILAPKMYLQYLDVNKMRNHIETFHLKYLGVEKMKSNVPKSLMLQLPLPIVHSIGNKVDEVT